MMRVRLVGVRVRHLLMCVFVNVTGRFGITAHMLMLVMRVVMLVAVRVSELRMDVLMLMLLSRKQYGRQNH